MGNRGPAKTPTAKRKYEGNPSRRPINENEPKFSTSAVACPSHLDELAREEWARLAPPLITIGLLTEADVQAFGGYCQSVSDYIQACRKVEKYGVVHTNGKGDNKQIYKSPFVTMRDKALENLRRMGQEFGLTPSSRAGLSVQPANDDDPLAQFLN